MNEFQSEAPFKQALTELWEQMRDKDVERVSEIKMRIFDAAESFKLLAAITTISGAETQVELEVEYHMNDKSRVSIEFNGNSRDTKPLKEFLDAQLRAAPEKEINTTFNISFKDGLDLSKENEEPENLTKRLTRFASSTGVPSHIMKFTIYARLVNVIYCLNLLKKI